MANTPRANREFENSFGQSDFGFEKDGSNENNFFGVQMKSN